MTESAPWLSVYAAHFLTLAAGRTQLPPGLLEDSLFYLESLLALPPADTSEKAVFLESSKAYAVYVLALNGRQVTAWVNALLEREPALSPSALLFLNGARALSAGNPAPLEALLQRDIDWDAPGSMGYGDTFESGPRNQAIRLLLLSDVDPGSDATAALAAEVSAAGALGRWGNTQENAFALIALWTFIQNSSSALPYTLTVRDQAGAVVASGDSKAPLSLGEGLLKGGQIGGKGGAQEGAQEGAKEGQEGAQEGAKEGAGEGGLEVEVGGEGLPWYAVSVSGVPLTAPVPYQKGLSVRSVWRVGETDSDPQGQSPTPLTLKQGELVTVTITVAPVKDASNVVVQTLFPGGLELERFEAGGALTDAREDRLIIVWPTLQGGGEYTHQVVLRAVTEGDYVIPPIVAEAMYEPGISAIPAPSRLTVAQRAGP
jgi:uncharacterized protein YfaS (alpha-2-macroglobulin family)